MAALRQVDIVPALPKTRSGKILRRTMREIADGGDPAVPRTIEDVSSSRPSPPSCAADDPLPTQRRSRKSWGSRKTWGSSGTGPSRRGPRRITPDGCAVEVYRRLPPAGEAELVHAAVPAGAAVLDLGCGVGRIAEPLAALGHRVVGVDESAAMLALLPAGVGPVRSRIEDLGLPTRFAGVLLASHLVDAPDAGARAGLLGAAARHVAAHGVLVAQWNPPDWFARLRPGGRYTGALGEVGTELEVLDLTPDAVEAVVRYSVEGLRWEQWFRAARLDVDALDGELAAAGLRRTGGWRRTRRGSPPRPLGPIGVAERARSPRSRDPPGARSRGSDGRGPW